MSSLSELIKWLKKGWETKRMSGGGGGIKNNYWWSAKRRQEVEFPRCQDL